MSVSILRVLVLEEQLLKRSAVVAMLQQLGCHAIYEAETAAEALALLRRVGAVDIAICDIRLEGFDAVRGLGRAGQVDAVILSSSLPDDLCHAARQIVTQLGLAYLGDIGAPFRIEQLSDLLNQHISRSLSIRHIGGTVPSFNEREILRAFAEKQMVAHFQPQQCLLTGSLYGVEVLVRWLHPVRGLVAPALFLPTLIRHKLMGELFFELLDQSLVLHRDAKRLGHCLKISLNIQPSQLEGDDMARRLQQTLEFNDVNPSSITLELVESEALEVSDRNLDTLFKLRMMGCQLAIDDFGVGCSSLQRLCQLPFTEIKVDGSFVRYLKEDIRSKAVIRSALSLGETLGLSVVVEGVETQEQRQLLLVLGCRFGQGYLMARPMSASALLQKFMAVNHTALHLDRLKPTG